MKFAVLPLARSLPRCLYLFLPRSLYNLHKLECNVEAKVFSPHSPSPALTPLLVLITIINMLIMMKVLAELRAMTMRCPKFCSVLLCYNL